MSVRKVEFYRHTVGAEELASLEKTVGSYFLTLGPRVRELHAFVSNFPKGPEYTAQARIHRRRLVWDVVYLDVDMGAEEAEAITRDMVRWVAPDATPVLGAT